MTTDEIPTPKRPRGKPKGYRKPSPRSTIIKVALSADEYSLLKKHAAMLGEKTSSYMRTAAILRAMEHDGSLETISILSVHLPPTDPSDGDTGAGTKKKQDVTWNPANRQVEKDKAMSSDNTSTPICCLLL